MFGLAGPFLAARLATAESDFRAAARYFSRAVAHDPTYQYLQDNALIALIAAGEMDRAVRLADELQADGRETELAHLVNRANAVHQSDWDTLLDVEGQQAAEKGDLLQGMVYAWALLGAGRAADSLAEFQRLSDLPGVGPIVAYHLGLARAMVGDYEGAETLLSRTGAADHLQGVIAHAQVLAQLDRRDDAVALLDRVPGIEAEPQLMMLRERLRARAPVSFDVVKTPRDGVALVFLTFAAALAGNPEPEPLSLIHARLAAWLSPANGEARLMVARLLQERGQYDLAEIEFDALRRAGEMRPVAELARIEALARADRPNEAERAALSLTAAYPELPQGWVALGDLLRQEGKFAQAVPAYDKALSLMKDAPEQARWFPLYARGIALERSGNFERAEADLLEAIRIQPENASLLNYLGYSWIDRNMNLDKALEMIKKAAALSPGDGYILDSLAWAYFRLGRYQEAVAPMEQAIATMASDPLVNDHLGDIYWKVGRHREAQIQWRRALSLPETDSGDVNPDRIRAKLERGLDAVLAEEQRNAPAQANSATNSARSE